MAAARVATDKLVKAVAQLETNLELSDSSSKKNQDTEKVRTLCIEVKNLIVSNDFNTIYKEDSRYAEQVSRSIQIVFRIVNHTDQNTRTFAEEMLDSILRSLLLSFHQYRVLVCLISEISRNGPARSLVAAYIRLANLVHLSKTNRVISYGVHICNAIGVMLKRPEDSIQQAIIQHTSAIFSTIGPRMKDQQIEKIFGLYQIAADNLELTGTANRAAVVVISQICLYYTNILQKAFVRCYTNVRMPDEFEFKSRLVGSLNTLKNIWPSVKKHYILFQGDMIKMVLASAVCCLYSTQSEVIVASMEFLEAAFNNPLNLMDKFDPTDFSGMLVWKPLLSVDKMSLSSKQEGDTTSLKSCSVGSTLDISNTECGDQPFNLPLVFPDSPRYHNEESDSDETGGDEEIIDPLMHSELYEEVNKPGSPPSTSEANDSFSTPGRSSNIPTQPPPDICAEGANVFVYTAATLGKIFLLAGLKGLKNDREVRISHKMLALNCLTSISSKVDLTNVTVYFDDDRQPLNEAVRFVLHEDDQLCASAIQFMVSLDRWNPSHHDNYLKVALSFQVIRKRALLQAFVGKQDLMIALNLVEPLLDLVQAQANSTYFLIQVTCAEFLANIRWNALESSQKKKYQHKCLKAYFDLLFAVDPKVSKAAVDNVPRLVRNADMTEFTSAFETGLPSEPLMYTGLIPAVLNLSKEYNFFNESPHYVLESNLEMFLQELTNYYIEDSEFRSHLYCNVLEALMESFPPTIYYEVWGGVSKSISPTPVILTAILDKCEASLASPSALTTGLNVISKIFAGMCEGYIVQVVSEQTTVERSSLPKLPDPPVLDRILLLALRTINMYYSLIAEHRSTLSQASTSLLNRPTMSPILTKRPSPSRIADISHLMGTNIHLSRKSSFLYCLTLNSVFPSIQGAYTNFLESLNPDHEQKFCGLLQAAMNCLGCICEMLSFDQLKPALEEILIYIKVVLEVAPAAASSLLHQMFKVVFGKNAANINLNCLNSLKMTDPLPPRNKEEMYYLRYANEFTSFSSLISRKDYISSYIHRELGWLKSDMLSKIHVPSSTEITTALEPFEGFVTQLRHIYNAYQSIEFKKTVLGVMCELPRNGIIYNMADPKKILLDLVIQQTQDPSFGNMEVLTEIILFLIVLARTSVLKFEHIVKIGSDLLEKANENNAKYVLQCIRVVVLELLYVQQVELDILYTSFNSRSKELFSFAPNETMFIWMLILHMTDKNSQKSISIDFFGNFSEYLSISETPYTCSFTLAAATLSMMSPSMFLPLDNFYKLLQKFIADSYCDLGRYWGRAAIILFVLLNSVEEEQLLMRLEDLIPDPLNWLSSVITKLLDKGFGSISAPDFPMTHFIHFLQILVAIFKSDRYKKLTASVSTYLEDAPFDKKAVYTNWSAFSQLLQLLKFSSKFSELLEHLQPRKSANSHLKELCNVFSAQTPEIPTVMPSLLEVREHETKNPLLLVTGNEEEVLKMVFEDSRGDEPAEMFNSILMGSSSSLYPFFASMPPNNKTAFLSTLSKAVKKKIRLSEGRDGFEKIVEDCQEFVDAIVDHVRTTADSTDADVKANLTVLSYVMEVVETEHTLTVPLFTPVEVTRCLQYASIARLDKHAVDGLRFVLRSQGVRQHFLTKPLEDLIHISELLATICKIFIKGKVKDHANGEHFIVNCASPEIATVFDDKSPHEVIGELFNLSQHIISHLQKEGHAFPSEYNTLLRTLFRHPVLHSLAMVPLAAFKMQWTLQIMVKGDPYNVHVPLVNIHMLCNIDVLQDFCWRINWMGWTSRQQFEDFWMSLFGVLSSTPTGAEIADNTNVTEQILASSLAVSALTDILLYTLLFPEPGNVPIGTFVVKDREKNELFYQSKTMNQLCSTLGILRNKSPEILFTQNLERLEEEGDCYDLGQLCAMALWTLTGDLRSSKKDSPEKTKVSLSEYLLKTTCELDTASSVRALFENFSHWFSRGLEFLPLPLLSATVRSMVYLSDLFDEPQSYEFLYNQIKVVYRGNYLSHHSDLGYVIYALLKTTTVIGVESVERTMTEADVAKMMLDWVETGMTSKYPFVRTATLHGILYILQSMAVESLKPVYQYVASFLLAEATQVTSTAETNAGLENSNGCDYQRLLWTVAFRLMEEPMQVNFRNNLNKVIVNYYLSPYCHPRTLNMVTSGAEELILHSASYVQQFLEITSQCFKEYSTMAQVFPFALRLFVVCVYREEMDSKRTQVRKFSTPLEELLSLYRRCDYRDAKRIAKVLVPVLLRLQQEEQALKTIFELLSGHSLYRNTMATLCMIYEFFQRLREARRTSSLQEFSGFARNKAKIFFEQNGKNQFIAAVILLASSPKEEIANRFYFVLNVPHETLTSSSFTQLLSDCHDLK